MKTPGLFPQPDEVIPRLSQRYGYGEYRSGPATPVKWARRAPRSRADCDECAALQHETHGKYWPRRQVRQRRTANGLALDLCGAHAQAWHDRDAQDGAP